MTGFTVRRYEQLETFPEMIEQELLPAVCDADRQTNFSIYFDINTSILRGTLLHL